MAGSPDKASTWPIIGHASQVERLRRMVTTGQYPLAILITGAPGVGRKALALQFAAASLCANAHDGILCGQCRTCALIATGRHPDAEIWSVNRQETESGTASKSGALTIETVRKIAASTALRPRGSRSRRLAVLNSSSGSSSVTINRLLGRRACLQHLGAPGLLSRGVRCGLDFR